MINYCNRSFATTMKAPLEKVIGSNIAGYLHPSGVPVVRELLDRSVQGPASDVVCFMTKDGSPLRAQLSISYLPTVEPPTYCLVVSDLTERIRAEERLRQVNDELDAKVRERTKDLNERREEMETLMDAVPATIWISRNAEGSDMVGNREVEKLVGLPPGANVSGTAPEGKRSEHFLTYRDGKPIPPDELPMQKAGLTGKAIMGTEVEFRFDDGRSVWVHGNVVPLKDENGSVRGAVGAFLDITERKKAEMVLQENEQRLRSHVENTPMAVMEWDSDFIVTRWAGEAERMFGWSASEVVGRPIMELNLIYEPDIPIVEATMAKLTDGMSRKVVSTNRNITKDGRIITCTWYNSVLIDEKGKTISVAVPGPRHHRTDKGGERTEATG